MLRNLIIKFQIECYICDNFLLYFMVFLVDVCCLFRWLRWSFCCNIEAVYVSALPCYICIQCRPSHPISLR
jgi:hypothetical protein